MFISALLSLALLLTSSQIYAHDPITFTSNKKEGVLDQDFLKKLIDAFNVTIFVETGTYSGGTTAQAAPLFKEIHTIELHEGMAKAASEKFKNDLNVIVYQGSSPEIFMNILPSLKNRGSILFFLDAHYCGENTAFDKEGPDAADGITAICKELEAIRQNNVENCVILIDDVRGFGTQTDDKKYLGCWAYPTVQEVCERLKKINPDFSFALVGDALLAFDKNNTNISFSPVVKACTISRLYDGHNYSKDELIEAEQIISTAQGKEKIFIEELYQSMTNYQDPEFHHDLWYGLLCLHAKKSHEAREAFNKVLNRPYNDQRIHEYIRSAN